MIADPAVRAIVDGGTRKFLTTGAKVREFLLWFLLAAVLVLAAGYFANKEATSNVADCTNTNLGLRNAPATADANAHIKFAEADQKWAATIAAAFLAPQSEAQQAFLQLQAATVEYRTAVDQYASTLQHDQVLRAASPLGKC